MPRTHPSWILASLLCLTVSSTAQEGTKHSSIVSSPPDNGSTTEKSIYDGLNQCIKWDFDGTPLGELVELLKQQTGIDFVIDVKSLNDAGVGLDTQFGFRARSLPVRSGLHIILRAHDLTWGVLDNAVTIMTHDRAESRLVQRVYDVRSLVRRPARSNDDYDTLIRIITKVIAPNSWSENGGPGAIEPFAGNLVVSQTQCLHEQVANLLQALHTFTLADPGLLSRDIDEDAQSVRAALERPIDLTCSDLPLADFVEQLSKLGNLNIVLDVKALNEAGVGTDTVVTVDAKNLPLKLVMARALRPLDLTWVVQHGVVSVTSFDDTESRLAIRLYAVRDLGLSFLNNEANLDLDGLPTKSRDSFDELIGTIKITVAPDSWDDAGGPGAAMPCVHPPLVVVAQTEEVHEQLAELLARIRRANKARQIDDAHSNGEGNPIGPVAGLATARPGETTVNENLQFVLYKIRCDESGTPIFSADELTRLIQKAIESESWIKEAGVFVEPLSGAVAVRHREAVQRRIRNLLLRTEAISPNDPQMGGAFSGGGLF